MISQETELIKITNDQPGDRIDKEYKGSAPIINYLHSRPYRPSYNPTPVCMSPLNCRLSQPCCGVITPSRWYMVLVSSSGSFISKGGLICSVGVIAVGNCHPACN